MQNQLPQSVFRQIVVFESQKYWYALTILSFDIPNLCKKWVLDCLLQSDSEVRIENKYPI